MLEDTVRIFDSNSLLKYEKNLFSLPSAVCATKQPCHHIVPPLHERFFTEHLRDKLQGMFKRLYSPASVLHVPMRYEEISQVQVFGQVYTSLKSCSRNLRLSWPSGLVLPELFLTGSAMQRISELNTSFCTHQMLLKFLISLTYLLK